LHNPEQNTFSSLTQVHKERQGIKTPIVENTSAFLETNITALHKINPNLLLQAFFHSEGGVIARRAIEMLSDEGKALMKQSALIEAFGPAMLIPDKYGKTVWNTYSEKDYITKRYAKEQNDGFSYNVRIVPCISPLRERTMWFADHRIMGPTYQQGSVRTIEETRKTWGYHNVYSR